jgi:hypothetical protein
MRPAASFADGAVLFSLWWAVWSLLDAYLLPLTPHSEIAVVCACGLALLARGLLAPAPDSHAPLAAEPKPQP